MPAKPKPSSPAADPIADFKPLWKDARIALAAAGRNSTADLPAYKRACAHATQHQIPGAVALLEATLLARLGKPEAGLDLITAAQSDLPAALVGYGHHSRGFVLNDLNRYDEAILAYQQALASPGYDSPGAALNGLGSAYHGKKDYDRAIEYYQQALQTLGYDTPGHALNNLGLAYAEKEDYDRSIEYFQQALLTLGYDAAGETLDNLGGTYFLKKDYARAIECLKQALQKADYKTPGQALNNLGVLYLQKKDYDRAAHYYRQALLTPGYDTPLIPHINLADTLRMAGRLDEAQKEIEKVLTETKTTDQHNRARLVADLIAEEKAGLTPAPGDEALAKGESRSKESGSSPEGRMKAKLLGSETAQKDKYDEYLLKETARRDDLFSCLRGWSSSVTLLEGGKDQHWSGGGYFLKWMGKGIVIDPGFDFLDNFHDAGYNGREVDAVLVSHNHPDHNYDLGSVNDLRYELHRRWKVLSPEKRGVLDLEKCLFAVDGDTKVTFPKDSADHRGAAMEFTKGAAEHSLWMDRLNGLPVTIEHFFVKHGDDVPNAVGFRLRLHREGQQDFIFGYTGDTEYQDGLPGHLSGCDVLLAHISMPDVEEFDDMEVHKPKHLGYNGLTQLLKNMTPPPKLTLVGEFWAGRADLRIELIQGLRARTGQAAILPTGLGFHLHLPKLEVECTGCRCRIPHAQVKIAPAATPFGPLGYLCVQCLA